MPQFRELVVSSESFKREARLLNDRLDQYASERLGKYETDQSIYKFSTKGSGTHSAEDTMTLGDDTVQFVHRLMWEAAKPIRGHNYRRYKGKVSDIVSGAFDLYSKEATWGLSKAVSNGLHESGRIRNSGKSIRGSVDVRVRPPDDPFPKVSTFGSYKPAYRTTRRDEEDIARQQAKAREERSVETIVDPSIIALPDPNPESVMEYVTKLTLANQLLTKKAQAAVEKIRLLNEQIEEFERAREADQWGKVVDGIKALVSEEA